MKLFADDGNKHISRDRNPYLSFNGISLAQRIYVMRTGQIILDDTRENMEKRTSLWNLF